MGKMPNQMVSSGTSTKVGVVMEATMYDHTPEQNRICAHMNVICQVSYHLRPSGQKLLEVKPFTAQIWRKN